MEKLRVVRQAVVCLIIAVGALGQEAGAQGSHKLLGGPQGRVRSAKGEPLEGIMIQLISQKNAIRTTVYSNAEGRYEFPKLETNLYTLRIARPMEFRPYLKESVRIDGATQLEDIVLEQVADTEWLPPTQEIAAQLTGAEWLMNLPGTGEEKRMFINSCNWCHSYQQIFRSRHDEQGWRTIVTRMVTGAGSPLINVREQLREPLEQREKIVQFLARVRGPEAKDPPFHLLPGPRGPATRVVVTEYELPRLELAAHDVGGDSKGNIWYTPHRSSFVGKLDPKSGVVTEYHIPVIPGALPGTHSVWVDKNDVVWFSENWAHSLTKFDPRTERFTQVRVETDAPVNSPGFGNFGLAPDGSIWNTAGGAVLKIDPETGKIVKKYPFKRIRSTYDNLISQDGNFWAGGQWPGNLVGMLDIRTGLMWEAETHTPLSGPAKGAFDREGNAWLGGRAGALIRMDGKTHLAKEYYPPTPYVSFYEAMPDKNGEIWASELHAGRFGRFDPRTEQWIEYVLPEPFAHNRRTWIDNSTDPVTVWYADHEGYMVRLQP
ncbi:MAG: carboxypeptidase regulatory-like domain-containing protein, partial [Acidobacteria bacterium]|nr:carboxypeptidase regulatory-like domain-containing protein [Acidobacteriota bacterium]